MTLPKKRRRNISVDGQDFHWTYNHETKRQGTTAIQLATGSRSLIKAIVIGELKPSHIENAIAFAKRDCVRKTRLRSQNEMAGLRSKSQRWS